MQAVRAQWIVLPWLPKPLSSKVFVASFHVIRGPDYGNRFAIRGTLATIGREAANQIRLNDTEVSRQHAMIVRNEDSEFEIRDAGSSNGTFVNSRQVRSMMLHSGDRVQVGRTLMIFTGGPEPHSTRSIEGVEIVGSPNLQDLSLIRQSFEGPQPGPPLGDSAELSESSVAPATKTSSQFDDWELIYQVSQAINRTVDLDELLRQVLDLIFEWIECDRGCVMLLDDVGGQLIPSYIRDRKQVAADKTSASPTRKLQISQTILDHVMNTREGVLISNAQDDSQWKSVESISRLGLSEAICVPMLGRYGVVGAIYIHTQMSPGVFAERQGQAAFEESHLKLLIAIAGQAALAIEDTQFYLAMLQSERLAAMGQTIANLSHHVKNILQGTSGGSYLVEDGLRLNNMDVVQRGWKMVVKNQDRISNLVMDMLSFSKDREPELTQGNLNDLVADVVELMASRADDCRVRLLHQAPERPVLARFDSEAMHRALLNVVTNAIDAAAAYEVERNTPAQVIIWAEAPIDGKTVSIHVSDNGEGIDPEDLLSIFSPFESSKGARGTGLGLPVSQKILREHGGDIHVASELGSGSQFTLVWPGGIAQDAGPLTEPG